MSHIIMHLINFKFNFLQEMKDHLANPRNRQPPEKNPRQVSFFLKVL